MAVSALILGLLGALVSTPAQMGNGRIELLKMPRAVARADFRPAEPARQAVSIPDGPLQAPRYAAARRPTQALAEGASGALPPSPRPRRDRCRQAPARWANRTDEIHPGTNAVPARRAGLPERPGENFASVDYGWGGVQLAEMPDENAVPRDAERLGSCVRSYFRQDVPAPAHQLSCFDWDKGRLSATVATAHVPATGFCIDTEDWIDGAWPEARGAADAPRWSARIANHFFDREHEREPLVDGLGLFVERVHG